MRRAIFVLLTVLLCMSALVILAAPSSAEGKYCLAFWRDRGKWDSGGCQGYLIVINAWVWDENGNPKMGVKLKTTWGIELATTDYQGYAEIVMDPNVCGYNVVCTDTNGSISDVTPVMTRKRNDKDGCNSFSYEIGFLYKADKNTPGNFDTNFYGTINTCTSYDSDAPYTKSMAFYSAANYLFRHTDYTELAASAQDYGQTFIANGDRVAGFSLHAVDNGTASNSTFYAQLYDAPGGVPNTAAPIGPRITFDNVAPTRQIFMPYPLGQAPQVTPGNSYYLKVWDDAGANISPWIVRSNTYASGALYKNGVVASPVGELQGFIVCMNNTTPNGIVTGLVKDENGNNIKSARVTITNGTNTYSTMSGASGILETDGNYLQSRYHLNSIPAGTYSMTVERPGYCTATINSVAVNSNVTTSQDITLTSASNMVLNNSFETGITSWTQMVAFQSFYSGEYKIDAHTAPNCAGKFYNKTGFVTGNGGAYQIISGLTPNTPYELGGYYYTECFNNVTGYPPVTTEWPTRATCRLGVDPQGGTNPDATNIVWTPWGSAPHYWEMAKLQFTSDAVSTTATVFLQYNFLTARDSNRALFDDIYLTTCALPRINIVNTPNVVKTMDSATITWNTNLPSGSKILYGEYETYGQVATVNENTTSHSVTLTGLDPTTIYHFKVISEKIGNQPAISGDYAFKTLNPPKELMNPDFEDGEMEWLVYGQFNHNGKWVLNDPAVSSPQSGARYAASVSNSSSKNGGLKQSVYGFNPGELITFTAWSATYAYHSNPDPINPLNANNRIGIDPTGGTDETASGIVWSPRIGTQFVWTQQTVTAPTSTGTVTVFLDAQQLDPYVWNQNFFDNCAIVGQTDIPQSIAYYLTQPDDTDVVLQAKRIVASNPAYPTGTFYIEEMDRSAGIRVVGTGTRLKGDELNIRGKMKTNADGERYIDAPLAEDITFLTESNPVADVLCLTGRDLGGMAFSESTPGVYQGKGLYNVGKLVTIFGKAYKPAGSAPGYFYLDDGSGLNDGNSNGFPGVRIEMGTWTIPAGNNFVVTGISTMKMVNGNSVRAVRPLTSTSTNIKPF